MLRRSVKKAFHLPIVRRASESSRVRVFVLMLFIHGCKIGLKVLDVRMVDLCRICQKIDHISFQTIASFISSKDSNLLKMFQIS